MFKLLSAIIAIVTVLTISTPNPASVYFKPGTPIQAAADLATHYDTDQFFTNFPGDNGRTGSRGFYFRNFKRIAFQSDETAERLDLNTLTQAQRTELQANPLVDHIVQPPQILAPAFFFLRRIAGRPN